MLCLYDSETNSIINYPREDEEPVVGLAQRYEVFRVVEQDKPEYDPATYRIKATRTVDIPANEWVWGWELVELPPALPAADWARFKNTVMAHPSVNLAIGGGISQVPAAAISLPATLLASAAGADALDFRNAWLSLRNAGLISVELLAEVRALAIDCHLPELFMGALGGALRSDAEYLGQEWVSGDGVLYRVTQARNEDGTFREDDPATTERESLVWEAVE